MRHVTKTALALSLMLLLASPLAAGEQQKKAKKKQPKSRKAPVVARFLPDEVKSTLTDEQKKKIAELDKEFTQQVSQFKQQQGKILTPKIRKARNEARKTAQAEGKKGKQIQQAVDQAVKLPPEKKKQLSDIRNQVTQIQKTFQARVIVLLNDKQKAKLPERLTGKRKAKHKGEEQKTGQKCEDKPKPGQKQDQKCEQKPGPKADQKADRKPKAGQKPKRKHAQKGNQKPKHRKPKSSQKPAQKLGQKAGHKPKAGQKPKAAPKPKQQKGNPK